MADPRRPRLIGYLNELDVTGPSAVADDLLAHLDLVDPLRALLADEDRFKDLMDTDWCLPGRVLAALREVAGLTHCAACHRPLPHTVPELTACRTAREVANGG